MKNQINLSIQTPCSKNFKQFSPTAKGGFCGSCEKEVIDFTKMNSQEIITFFNSPKNTNTCGKFNSTQLKTYHQKAEKNKILNLISGIGFACLTLFSIGSAQAQETQKDKEESSQINASKLQQDIVIKGRVLDESGLPLPMANILLEGTSIGVATDIDGYFEFPKKLKKGDVLLFSYIGYEAKKIVINNENSISNINLEVDMAKDAFIIMGDVAVKKVYKSKRK